MAYLLFNEGYSAGNAVLIGVAGGSSVMYQAKTSLGFALPGAAETKPR
jgi:hypothetical protein